MKIPHDVIKTVEEALEGVDFGTVCLEIKIHDNQIRCRITKEISIIPGKQTSGGN